MFIFFCNEGIFLINFLLFITLLCQKIETFSNELHLREIEFELFKKDKCLVFSLTSFSSFSFKDKNIKKLFLNSKLKCAITCYSFNFLEDNCHVISYNEVSQECLLISQPVFSNFSLTHNFFFPLSSCFIYKKKEIEEDSSIFQEASTNASNCIELEQMTGTIPWQDCSLPFIFQGRLYYNCGQIYLDEQLCNTNFCLNSKQEVMICITNKTVDMSIPTLENISTSQGVVQAPVVVGWIIIQNRVDNSTNFNRTWNEYKNGFGDFNGSFWLGLENMYKLTESKVWLRLEVLINQTWYSDVYKDCEIHDEGNGYKIHVGGYQGFNGDVITKDLSSGLDMQDQKFSTFDVDNDKWKEGRISTNSGWWFQKGHSINLNGPFGDSINFRYVVFKKKEYAGVRKSRMMIKIK